VTVHVWKGVEDDDIVDAAAAADGGRNEKKWEIQEERKSRMRLWRGTFSVVVAVVVVVGGVVGSWELPLDVIFLARAER